MGCPSSALCCAVRLPPKLWFPYSSSCVCSPGFAVYLWCGRHSYHQPARAHPICQAGLPKSPCVVVIMGSRPPSQEAAQRSQLLQEIAAKREARVASNRALAAAASTQLPTPLHPMALDAELEDSSDDENVPPPLQLPRATGAGRLKPHDVAKGGRIPLEVDDLAAQVGGMRLNAARPGGAATVPPLHTAAAVHVVSSDDDDDGEEQQEQEEDGSASDQAHAACSDDDDFLSAAGSPAAAPASAAGAAPSSAASGGASCSSAAATTQVSASPLVLGEKGEFVLDAQVAGRLYPHQVDGVKWLFSLYRMRCGGILGELACCTHTSCAHTCSIF